MVPPPKPLGSWITIDKENNLKIPKNITPAWVQKNGEAVGSIHRGSAGYKACLLKKRGPKHVHFTQLFPKRNFTLTHREAANQFKPYARKKGKWVQTS